VKHYGEGYILRWKIWPREASYKMPKVRSKVVQCEKGALLGLWLWSEFKNKNLFLENKESKQA